MHAASQDTFAAPEAHFTCGARLRYYFKENTVWKPEKRQHRGDYRER